MHNAHIDKAHFNTPVTVQPGSACNWTAVKPPDVAAKPHHINSRTKGLVQGGRVSWCGTQDAGVLCHLACDSETAVSWPHFRFAEHGARWDSGQAMCKSVAAWDVLAENKISFR